jgi:hypothetical protein
VPRGQRDGSLRPYSRLSRPGITYIKMLKLLLYIVIIVYIVIVIYETSLLVVMNCSSVR